MIHEDNIHHLDKIVLSSTVKIVIPFLFTDLTIMPLQPVTGMFSLKVINVLVLYKLELLAECCTQEAHKCDVNNLQ